MPTPVYLFIKNSGATKYEISWKPATDANYNFTDYTAVNASNTVYTEKTIQVATDTVDYNIRIVPITNGKRCSAYYLYLAAVCAKVQDFEAEWVDDDLIITDIDRNVGAITEHYLIQWKLPADASWTNGPTLNYNQTQQTPAGLLPVTIPLPAIDPGVDHLNVRIVTVCGGTGNKILGDTKDIPRKELSACTVPEDLAVEILGVGNGISGVKVLFTHIPGVNTYTAEIRKVAPVGDGGSILIGAFPFTAMIGETTIVDAGLTAADHYYVRIKSRCDAGDSAYSASIHYRTKIVTAVASGFDDVQRHIAVSLNAPSFANTDYSVTYKLMDTTSHGPVTVSVLANIGRNETQLPVTGSPIDVDPVSFAITTATPNVAVDPGDPEIWVILNY